MCGSDTRWICHTICTPYISPFECSYNLTMSSNVSGSVPIVQTTSTPCIVDGNYFPHFFLIPAGIIITILAFLRKRRSFMTNVWGGRPGIVVPIDFLGIDNDRLAIMFVFGAATGSILNLITGGIVGKNAWETAFLGIGIALEIAFLYYPYFGCLASYHRIIGALMGLPYALTYLTVSLISSLQKCNDITTWKKYVLMILPKLPTILCHLFIIGKFIIVLYQEIKDYGIFGIRFFSHDDHHASHQVKLIRPWLVDHVKDLIKSTPSRQYSGIGFYLRKIYNPAKNFKFSTQTLSVVMVCFILLYNISFQLIFISSYELDIVRKTIADSGSTNLLVAFRGLFGCLMGATIFAVIFCIVSFIRFLENHKNNMLKMFKGDKSFIPESISASQFMIGKGLRYSSYQIGYFLWGYVLLLLLLFVICLGFYSLSFKVVQDYILKFIKGGGVVAGVALLTGLSLPLASFTIFRDYEYPKDIISVNNRNVYLVFSYFWFFVGLPMGFFSAISRILKAMAIGAVMLTRIDHSVMPDGFQQIDQGFNAYICYLHVQTAYRNPILRVFCQMLINETESRSETLFELGNNRGQKWTYSPQARARWFLALTLIRNPQLASHRKPEVKETEPGTCGTAKPDHVEIEVRQYGADNCRLIQDK